MKIDIFSDIHINSHTKYINPEEKWVENFWKKFKPEGEILIIAGDIGEINEQNVNFLKTLKKLFYKEIFCVFGNHDLHCLNNRVIYLYDENKNLISQPQWENHKLKIENAKKLYKENNIKLLDNEIIDYNGIKIAGTMGWYDGQYAKIHRIDLGKHWLFKYREYFDEQELWEISMPDKDILPIRSFNTLLKEELLKIENIYEQCDIMVTHINPAILKEYQNPFYINNPTTSFYNFNGLKYLNKFKGKYWIFGHSHFNIEKEYEGKEKNKFTLLSNTLGYPDENKQNTNFIKTIEI